MDDLEYIMVFEKKSVTKAPIYLYVLNVPNKEIYRDKQQ